MTVDAMHTQKANARAVTQAGGDDVLALKGNQGTLYEDVSLFLDAPGQAGMCDACQQVDGAHGHIETRRALLGHDLAWLNARHDWPGLKAIGKAIATREKERRPRAKPQTKGAGKPRHDEASGPQPGAGGKVRRFHARQAQKSQMA